MSGLKILHSADWHIGSVFEALPPEKARHMRALLRAVPERIAATANERGADLVLLAGDLFDSPRPSRESREAVVSALSACRAPVFIAPGNHDPMAPGSAWDGIVLPDNVYIFKNNCIERVELPFANVYGAAFTEPYSRAMLTGFCAPPDGKPNILVMHGELSPSSRYCPVSEREIAASGMDYIALGHTHRPSGLRRAGNVWYSWPGCPMGRGFDECGPRGVGLVTLAGGECGYEFIETAPLRYETVEVDALPDAASALRAAVENTREGSICRFVLRGESASAVPESAFRAMAESRGLFAAELRDETVPPRGEAAPDTLRGCFLSLARERLAAASTEEERLRISRAVRWGEAALFGDDEPWEVRG